MQRSKRGSFMSSHLFIFLPCTHLLLPRMQVGETNHEKRAMKAEKKAARFAIMPVLQAEEDRRYGSALHLSSSIICNNLSRCTFTLHSLLHVVCTIHSACLANIWCEFDHDCARACKYYTTSQCCVVVFTGMSRHVKRS